MRVLLLAGEPSGDRIGAHVARALREREPGVELRAMGGAALRAEGVPLVVDSTPLAVVGISEVLGVLPALLRARSALRRAIRDWRPDVLVPIDYPDFNLRLATWARRRGVRVAWLVSPQVWAWRPSRVPAFARAASRMLVLFGFEVPTWRDAGVPVTHVGHPLLDHPPPPSREEARASLGLDRTARVLAVLPGSRRSEIARTWPVFEDAAVLLQAERPDLRVVVPLAPGVTQDLLPQECAGVRPVFVPQGMTLAVAACDVALAASGTATLETALVPRPLVVGYRLSRATMLLSRRLADPAFLDRGLYCLPNLVLGRSVVPELYQERFTAHALAAAAAPLLDSEEARASMEAELMRLREALGGPGVHARIAAAILEVASGPP